MGTATETKKKSIKLSKTRKDKELMVVAKDCLYTNYLGEVEGEGKQKGGTGGRRNEDNVMLLARTKRKK